MNLVRAYQSSAVLPHRPSIKVNARGAQTADPRRGASFSLRKTIAARIVILLTTVSCIQFFNQENQGFSQFDYTQTIIKLSALGLGFAVALYLVTTGGFRGRFGKGDILFCVFGLSSLMWAWRSWNPNLSIAHAVCYLIVVFNIRVALDVVGVRETFTTLYRVTCCVVVASLVVSVILPQQFPLFTESLGRRRLSLFQIHPIEVADIMVLNLIVGRFIKMRFRMIGQALCAIILVCTASRASVLGGVVILLASGFQANRSKWRTLFRGATILAFVSIVAWLAVDPASLVSTLFPTADTDILVAESIGDSGLNGRLPLWIGIINRLSLENLMGYGFAGYREMLINMSGWAGHAHNSILDGILAAGYIGGLSLFGYLLYGLLRSRKGFQPIPRAMCQCLIWYALFDGMMGPTWLDEYQIMYLSAAIYWTSVAAGSRNRYRGLTQPSTRGTPHPTYLPTPAGL